MGDVYKRQGRLRSALHSAFLQRANPRAQLRNAHLPRHRPDAKARAEHAKNQARRRQSLYLHGFTSQNKLSVAGCAPLRPNESKGIQTDYSTELLLCYNSGTDVIELYRLLRDG